MAGPIARVPIADVQAYMGDSIKRLQEIGATGQMLQIALSITEYLKDAERWHAFRNQEIVFYPDVLPDEMDRIADEHLRKRGNSTG